MTTDKCKVLIVEDEEDVRTTVVGVLDDDGYFVRAAANEVEALRELKKDTFNFIVMDIHLQGYGDESGLKLTKTIREYGIESQIIFITGQNVKVEHFDSALKYGVIGYIKKDGNWVETVIGIIVKNYSKFDVFLCHNGKDKQIVKNIGEELKVQNIRPWLDEWELQPGLPWQRIIEAQIGNIKSAAVCVGKDGLGPWQEIEMEALLREFVRRRCPR